MPNPFAASTSFSTMLKPVGSRCNMDCQYCYYLSKGELYSKGQACMSDSLLEEYIRQYIEANDTPVISFAWHGGEPLLSGLTFYKKAIALQNKYKGARQIENTLQTNGLLVTEEWCHFWRENQFLIGISIDGPADIHDAFRTLKGGKPSFHHVMAAIEMMQHYGVEFNTLSTVNAMSAGRGAEIYQFLKSIGSHYMQFLPVVEYVMPRSDGQRSPIVAPHTAGSVKADWSIKSRDFGHFMVDIFDHWVRYDVGEYYVQLFDVTLVNCLGGPSGLCAFSENCGTNLVVEHNGDVYSCDHFVYPEHRLGNMKETSLRELALSPQQKAFARQKNRGLAPVCLSCEHYRLCHGGCPKHRFEKSRKGEGELNTLCRGYHLFFSYVRPYMDFMAQALQHEQPPALVMLWVAQHDAAKKKP